MRRRLPALVLAALAGLAVWAGCHPKEPSMTPSTRPLPAAPAPASAAALETATFALG